MATAFSRSFPENGFASSLRLEIGIRCRHCRVFGNHISRNAEICLPSLSYSFTVNSKFPLASTAALIADPARAAMLTLLLDARPRSAGELALSANVSAQSASMHLSQLLAGGFLKVSREGRHRYYCIANPDIAHAVEALGTISTAKPYKPSAANRDLCFARTCYDHLAGELGVRLTAALEQRRALLPSGEREYELTQAGHDLLARWEIDIDSLRKTRRTFARRCLDWTERR